MLRSCLQRDAKQRLGDMQSVRLALEGAFEAAAPQTTTPMSASGGRLAWIAAFAVAAVLAGGMAIPTVRHLRETLPLPP